MKFNAKAISALPLLALLTGCFGGSDSKSPKVELVTFQLKDEAVDGLIFERNGSVISQNNFIQNLSNFFINSAYAAVDRKIECAPSDKLKFDMDILGTPLVIELSCSAALEKRLRAAMLESMAGKEVIIEYSGGGIQLDEGRVLKFRSSNEVGTGVDAGEKGFFGKYNDIFANGQNDYCRETYEFKKDGTVTQSLDVENTKARADLHGYPIEGHGEDWDTIVYLQNADEVVENCVFLDGGLEGYKVTLNYRFKDGYLEFDPEGTDFSDNLDPNDHSTYMKLLDYQRACVKKNNAKECDTSRLPGGTYIPLEEVCHETEVDNCPKPINPWE